MQDTRGTDRRSFRFDGDALARLRSKAGLRQSDLAEIMDVDDRTVQTWEAGGSALRTRIEKNSGVIRDKLGVDIRALDAVAVCPDRTHVIEKIERFLEPVLNRRYKGLPPITLPAEQLDNPSRRAGGTGASKSTVSAFAESLGSQDPAFRSMVIVGEPGIGKSVTLLDLTASLLAEARRGCTRPVVVWLDAASWSPDSKSLREWMLQRFQLDYGADALKTRRWLDRESRLRLMVDGLDNLDARWRRGFVERLKDTVASATGTHAVVLCARASAADVLTHFSSRGMVIKRLQSETIRRYMKASQKATPLARLKTLGADRSFYEVLDTPLMLSLAVEAFADRPLRTAALGPSEPERFAKLTHLYVDHVVRTRTRLDPRMAEKWLAWLAERLSCAGNDTKLRLEAMQPDWLPKGLQRRCVTTGMVALSGLLVGLAFGVGTQLALDWDLGLVKGLALGLGGGILFGLLPHGDRIRPVETFRVDWPARVREHPWQLLLGSGTASLVVGLPSVLAGGSTFGLGAGTLTGLLFLALYPIPTESNKDPPVPNQAIWRSLTHASLSGLIAAPVVGAMFGGALGLGYGITAATVFGVIVGLLNGGFACLQHLALRILLVRNDATPIRYVAFLNRMVEINLLDKKGGAFEFRHEKLREFFSQLVPRSEYGGSLLHPLVEGAWYSAHLSDSRANPQPERSIGLNSRRWPFSPGGKRQGS